MAFERRPRRPHPGAAPAPDTSPYQLGLRMLARRELSAAQIRERLGRRGFDADTVEQAIAELQAAGALDDGRVARAVARTRVTVNRQGRARVTRELAALGLAEDAIRGAVDEAFGGVDEDALIDQALARRLRNGSLADPRIERRVFAALVRQGFAADAIRRAFRRHRRG